MSFAPSLNYPGGAGLGDGSNPITPAGRIGGNAKIDLAQRDEAKLKIQMGRAGIIGGTADSNWYTHHNEVVVTERTEDDFREGREAMDISTYIIPCANGFGLAGESQAQLTERIGQVFISSGRRMVDGQSSSVAITMGGLITIALTGPKGIRAGERVMVVAPDPADPTPYPLRPDIPATKISWWVVPVNEEHTLGGITSAYKLMTKAMTSNQAAEYKRMYPYSAQFAAILQQHTLQSSFAAIVAAVRAGVVAPLRKEQWSQQRAEITAPANGQNLDDWQVMLARQLLELENNGRSLSVEEADRYYLQGDAGEGDLDLGTYMVKTAFAEESAYELYSPTMIGTGGRRVFDDVTREQIVLQQKSNNKTLVAGLRHCDASAQRLCLGTALNTAMPGQDLDVHLGANLI